MGRRQPPCVSGRRASFDRPARWPPSARFRFDHGVYVVWRPWEGCGRCRAALEKGELTLPDRGDHVCPHTRHREYLALLADRALGKCEFTSHEPTTLPSGVIQIAVGVAWARSKEELVAMGLARVDHASYGALRLTEAARPVLRGIPRASVLRRSWIRQAFRGVPTPL